MNYIKEFSPMLPEHNRSNIPFHVLSKAIGSSCNLACKYCYYPQESHPTGKMPDALLETFIQQYIRQHPLHSQSINFVWQGGEPTLAGIAFFEKVIALQQKYAPKNISITNSIQTNGTLLDLNWALFFKKHSFIVGISLDGDALLNDKHRVDKKGASSFTATIRGLHLLQKMHIDYNLLVLVHDDMVERAIELYDYFTETLNVQYLQFQPLTSGGRSEENEYTLSAQNWGLFLSNIYQHWLAKKDRGKVFVLNIENAYAQYFTGFSPTCVHSKVCGNLLALETDGNVYACDHLISPEYRVGNLHVTQDLSSLVLKSAAYEFGQMKSRRPECQSCEVKILCEGGCPTHIKEGKNILCSGYYQFFSNILSELKPFSRQGGLNQWQTSFKSS